ncbi:HD domain-containing protein [Lyngbya confervoides]|uniref:HD domain-containing protein n=1 Tax=Lyngbya confervoides BDU141951 TaxID=1574623 RepID=A0ABD4T5B6_9CYAN|nr:HD domain-containing protein [Lyngbya confervoides]MCM1983750.1 HD domain-containing protein [Lyngbya confervoides BDU141951]
MSETTEHPILSDRFSAAFALAESLHRDQVRKGSQIPYISHLMAVSALVLEDGGNETEAIAALLHDAVEDQGGLDTLADIQQHCGDAVAEIVQALSDAVVTPKPPWRQRKEAYLETLAEASESALRVAIADKLHNTRCQWHDYQRFGDPFWNRFNASKQDCLWLLDSFIDLCQERRIASQNLEQLEQLFISLSTYRPE